jgi:hypothetical protein
MQTRFKFSATFSTGETITRNTDNLYSFAWAVIRIADGKIENFGFSADPVNAAKGASAKLWKSVSVRDRKNPAMRRYWAGLAKQRGFASVDALIAHWDAEAIAVNAGRRIEIVKTEVDASRIRLSSWGHGGQTV